MTTTTATSAPIDQRPAIDRTAGENGWTLTHDDRDRSVYQRNTEYNGYPVVAQVAIRFSCTGAVILAYTSIWNGDVEVQGASIDGHDRGATRGDRFRFVLDHLTR